MEIIVSRLDLFCYRGQNKVQLASSLRALSVPEGFYYIVYETN
jgi:hypothetical protein